MISVVVRRGSGTRPGTNVVDPLIKTLPVALARGRNELDEQSGLQPVEVETSFRTGLRLGQVVQVVELLFGTVWYGKIEGIAHRAEFGQKITTLSLKRPTDFYV